MIRFRFCLVMSVVLGLAALSRAGVYSAHSNEPGNTFDAPIAFDDPIIAAWATTAISYQPSPGVNVQFAVSAEALGIADATTTAFPGVATVSLGDLEQAQIDTGDNPGSITLGFALPITNGAGADFTVFENGFDNIFSGDGSFVFGELAYVEVSSDGVNFARFPSVSANLEADMDVTFGRNFAAIDPTNVYNLAGKHLAGWGTPFDLDDLTSDPLVLGGDLDLSAILYVRLVDVPGNGEFLDSLGNGIVDSWSTVGSGGLDLDAVGVIHQLPEPATMMLVMGGGAMAMRRRR